MAESQARNAAVQVSDRAHERNIKRVFLMPTVAILLALSIFPLLWSLSISFTDYQRGGTTAVSSVDTAESGFLGLGFNLTTRNYIRMASDQRLHTAARNTLTFVIVGVIVQYVVGFGLALVLNQPFFGRNVVRVIFLMPMMMTPVAAAYTGRMLFDTRISPQAQLQRELSSLLGTQISIPWLTDGFWATVAIILIDSWQWIPFMTLLLLAGMQSISEDIYEAARVDGANAWQILQKITFPILLPITVTVILIRGLEIFKIIDIIVVTTGGGPGSATESLTMYIFDTALTFGNYGYAAAISYALLVLVIIFATLFLTATRRVSRQSAG
ncbi:MAG: sugar ABC transporter permease [Chloroflexi bacterium]|nr:MAG: sugar ABC transporter permease [Chloroflexota bacterium]